MPEYTHTLIATLGGQPQVVTFTLDLLLEQGFPIREVYVIHPEASQPRLHRSLTLLSGEFAGDCYRFNGHTLHFRSQVLRLDDDPLDDITNTASAYGALNTIQHLICDLKRQRRHIHLSVSGGRRLMSLLALSLAFLHFDHQDHIWHIYTPDAIKERVAEGKKMHVPPGAGVRLIESPFVPWGAYFQLSNTSIQHTLHTRAAQMDAQERMRCDQVYQQARERERDVLRAFAKGMIPQEVALHLGLSIKTIDTYKTGILALCRNAWNKSPKETLDYRFLQKAFANYFEDDE